MPTTPPKCLLLNGTVGSGKTTTAHEIGGLLREAGVPHAIVDLDALRSAWPSPADDPFQERLTLLNLRDVARNHLAAGAVRLVLAGVLEDPAEKVRYAEAVGVPLTVCRLRVDLDAVASRLHGRHVDDPDGLDWHLHRSGELDGILDAAGTEDVSVRVGSGRTRTEVARAVLHAIGW